MDSVVAGRTQCTSTQTGSRKNVWLFMNCLHFPWRKRQQQDEVIVWVGSCPQGHAWPMHSQRTQPPLSIVQPHNHHHCVRSAHVIWTNVSSKGSFWLGDDITDSVSTFGLDCCWEKNNSWQFPQSSCFVQFGWRQFVPERWVGVSFCLFPFWELFLPVQNRK